MLITCQSASIVVLGHHPLNVLPANPYQSPVTQPDGVNPNKTHQRRAAGKQWNILLKWNSLAGLN